jgi:hypothetical protein
MPRPYIQWDPDLLRAKATADVHGPLTIDSESSEALLVDLFARLSVPRIVRDIDVGYVEAEMAASGGSTEPARGLGRFVPTYMPSPFSFYAADPVNGEPMPFDVCDPILMMNEFMHALLGWRAPLRGWTGSVAEGNLRGEWRLRWGDPILREAAEDRGAWTGMTLALYDTKSREIRHLFIVAHGKRPHDANWIYSGAYCEDPNTPGAVTFASVAGDNLDHGFVRVVISGASPWTCTLECSSDGVSWATILTAPVDFLSGIGAGDEGEIALVFAPFLASATVQPAFPGEYTTMEQWVDDIVVPSFSPWVPDVADWTMRDAVAHIFGATPPIGYYNPWIRHPKHDLILMPVGSVGAPVEAPVFVTGFGAGVRFASTSHGFCVANADARLVNDPPSWIIDRVVPCANAFARSAAPFAIALELLPEDMASWPSPANIWKCGTLDLVWDNTDGGRLVAHCYDATLGTLETSVPFLPADRDGVPVVVALAWTGNGSGVSIFGVDPYQLSVVVDGLLSTSVLSPDFSLKDGMSAEVGSTSAGSGDGFIGVLGRVSWFMDVCLDQDLGPAAFAVPSPGFLNPSFEDASASGRPGEAEFWEWRSPTVYAGHWAEFNATSLDLDGWRTAREDFEAAWDDNEDWVSDLVISALAAALFNHDSPTYYGTTESFEIWGFDGGTLGPNWFDSVTFIAPFDEVPPTGFSGWYDYLMGTHVAPLAVESFEEAWGTDPLSSTVQPWWPGTAPGARLYGKPLTFPVTIPPDRDTVVMYRDLDATVHRMVVANGTYATAAALAAAFDFALLGALGASRIVVCEAYTSAQGDGLALSWDGLTLGAESFWFGYAERLRWNDALPLLGFRGIGPEGLVGAVRYPAALLPSVPSGYTAADVFVLDPWTMMDFYTSYDVNCGWFPIPYGMLVGLFDTWFGGDTVIELFSIEGWTGESWVDDLDPGTLTTAMFDSGTSAMEHFNDTTWPDWIWP